MALSTALLYPRSRDGLCGVAPTAGDGQLVDQKIGSCHSDTYRTLTSLVNINVILVHLPGFAKLSCKLWQLWLLIAVAIGCSHSRTAFHFTGNPVMQVHMRNIFDVYQVPSVDALVYISQEQQLTPHLLVAQGRLSPVEGEIVRELLFSYGSADYNALWVPKDWGVLKFLSEKFQVHLGRMMRPSEILSRDFLYHAVGLGRELPKQEGMVTVTDHKPEEMLRELNQHLNGPDGYNSAVRQKLGQYYSNIDNPAWHPEFLRLTPSQRADWLVMKTNYSFSRERGLFLEGMPQDVVTPVEGLTLTEMSWPSDSLLRGSGASRNRINSSVIDEVVRDVWNNLSLAEIMDCVNGVESSRTLVTNEPFNVVCTNLKLGWQDCAFLIKFICARSLAAVARSGGLYDSSEPEKLTPDVTMNVRRLSSLDVGVDGTWADNEASSPYLTDIFPGEENVKGPETGHYKSVDSDGNDLLIDNSPRRLSGGYGDEGEWSMIEGEYPNLGTPPHAYVELKSKEGKHNQVRAIQSIDLRTYFNWPSDCTADDITFPKDLELDWKDSSGKSHTLAWPNQEFELDGVGLCEKGKGESGESLSSTDKHKLHAAKELLSGPSLSVFYTGKAVSNDQALYNCLSKEVDGSIWTGHKWVSAKASIGCSAMSVHKTWRDDTSITLQPDPRVCKDSDYPLYISAPMSFTTSTFYAINDTTTRPASEIFTTGGYYIARQSAIADFNPYLLDSSWFKDWSVFLAMDHCDLRCAFAPKSSFAASSAGIVTTDVPGVVIHRGQWRPVIKGAQIAPLCQAACSSAESLMAAGEQCIGTCSKVPVEWSTIGAESGLKSRNDWIKSLRVTYASIGSLGQIMFAETLPFGYLLMQLVFMLAEACYGTKRQPITVWIVSSILVVGAILYIGVFGPTTTAFMMSAFTITGLVLSFAATYVTANEPVPVSEYSLMVMIFLVQGVASITYSSVVRTFANLLMGISILIYGLLIQMPVVGLPVFYLLVLFSASTNVGFTGPYVMNSVWDYVYLFEVFAGYILQDQFTGAQVLSLLIDFITRVFLITSLLAVSASGGTLYNYLSNLRMTGIRLPSHIIPTILLVTNPICVTFGVIFWELRFSYLDELTPLKQLGESFEVKTLDELSRMTHDQKSFAAAVLTQDVQWVSDAVFGSNLDPKKLNLIAASRACTRGMLTFLF